MRYLVFLTALFFTIHVYGQENILGQANQHYTKGEFRQAISLYTQILLQGKESSEVYFNLGNSYFKMKDYNQAILNYERALLLSPNDEDIRFNIRMANQYVVDNPEALPKPFFTRWADSLINSNSTDRWAGFSLAAFIVFLLALGLFFFSRSARVKRISFGSGLFLLLVSVIFYSFASKQKGKLVNRDHAVVFCPRVTVKSSPSASGTDLFLIHEGLKVQVTDSLGNWKEIRLIDGNQGWLPDTCIVRI